MSYKSNLLKSAGGSNMSPRTNRTYSMATTQTDHSMDTVQLGRDVDANLRDFFAKKNELARMIRSTRKEDMKSNEKLPVEQAILEKELRKTQGIITEQLTVRKKRRGIMPKLARESSTKKTWQARLNNVNDLLDQVHNLGNEIDDAKSDFEIKLKSRGNICGVYNFKTGRVEYLDELGHGVFGVYHPLKEEILWKKKRNAAVSGCWNPEKKAVHMEVAYAGSICCVYNEKTKEVETKVNEYGPVCGIYNPAAKMVEWKQSYDEDGKNTTITGYYSATEGKVIFKEFNGRVGITCVYKSPDGRGYKTCATNSVFLAEDVEVVKAFSV